MNRIYRYNSNASYKPNGGTYLQLITAKDLYIQNVTVAENDGHSDSFQVKFPNIFKVCTISFERPVNYLCDAWHVFLPKYKAWTHVNN